MIIVILFIGTAVIYGIINYFRMPKPPDGLSRKQLKYYYGGGWKDYAKQLKIDNELYLLELEENEKTKIKLYKDIEFLTAHITMLEDLERLIEKDIHNGIGSEKVNLSRLISIDKQIYTAQQKIDKLNDKLENL